jgi:hypothetical protein
VTRGGDQISRMAFECVGEDGKVGLSWTFTLTPADASPIDLPTDATDSREYIAEHLNP